MLELTVAGLLSIYDVPFCLARHTDISHKNIYAIKLYRNRLQMNIAIKPISESFKDEPGSEGKIFCRRGADQNSNHAGR